MITLAVDSVVVELPGGLYWADEFDWSPISQSLERSLTGALIVDQWEQQAGRPITLRSQSDRRVLVERSALEQLLAWAAEPELEMVLTIRGVSRTVMWRHHERPAIEATPVHHYVDVQPSDLHVVTLKFFET